MLSQIKDVDLKILSELDDKDLFSFCKLNIENKYVYKLCNDENFWRQRTFTKFGRVKKNDNRTWKEFYLQVVYYSDKYGQDLEDILKELSKKGMKNIDIISFFFSLYIKEIIKAIEENTFAPIFPFLYETVKNNHIDLMKYYLEMARKYSRKIDYENEILSYAAQAAAENGDVETLRFLISEGLEGIFEALEHAARHGQLNAISFLISAGANPFYGLYVATQEGRKDVMEFILQRMKEEDMRDSQLLKASIIGGRLDIIKYVLSIRSYKDWEIRHAISDAFQSKRITKEKGQEILHFINKSREGKQFYLELEDFSKFK